ncbi:hypothetical protein LCGC14_3040810, partial [marine sediment metagenome]
ECMDYPSFVLKMHSTGGVLFDRPQDEPEKRLASLWALFLWKAYSRNVHKRAWSAIKSCCTNQFPTDENKYNKIITKLIPFYLIKIIEFDRSINDVQKMSRLVEITQSLGTETTEFEKQVMKIRPKPKFMR